MNAYVLEITPPYVPSKGWDVSISLFSKVLLESKMSHPYENIMLPSYRTLLLMK